MPAGYLYRFDGGENIWRRDYHRSDQFFGGARINAGVSQIFNNIFDYDYLISSACLTVTNMSDGANYGSLLLTTSTSAEKYHILRLYVHQGATDAITASFPMPIEVNSGDLVKVTLTADGIANGGFTGVKEES